MLKKKKNLLEKQKMSNKSLIETHLTKVLLSLSNYPLNMILNHA